MSSDAGSNSSDSSSETSHLKLNMATVHYLYPKWFKHLCCVLADAHLLHTIKPTMCPPNPPHARTQAAAVIEDPTLEAFTSINAVHIIHANIDYSYAVTLPDTGFAYDLIKQIYNLYFDIASYPPFVNKKLQAWLSLEMTANQSIADYWYTVTGLLKDLKELAGLPEVAPFVKVSHIKHHVVDRLHSEFGSFKSGMSSDDTIGDKLELLIALLDMERTIHWTPDATTAPVNSRRKTNNKYSPYQRPPHALELRERPSTPCPICIAATSSNHYHWKNQCYRNPRYLQECLKPLPANVTLIPFERVGRDVQGHPDLLACIKSDR
ncbi:hypothetical protein HDU81_002995 [Chytriomyces hyalinus]|nr:hypothetical protein HDU81_002995 [Chytriomyces hyalinus]